MEKFKETDERILTVARRLFSQNGIVNIEMNDIVKELGCSRSTLYRHFSSKEDILYVLAGNSVVRIMDAAIIPPRKTFQNGYEAFSWQLRMQVNFMLNNVDELCFIRDFDYFFASGVPDSKELKRFETLIITTRGRKEMLDSLTRGMEDGSIRKLEDAKLVLYSLINACIGFAQRVLPREGIYKRELGYSREMIECHLELLLHSIQS